MLYSTILSYSFKYGRGILNLFTPAIVILLNFDLAIAFADYKIEVSRSGDFINECVIPFLEEIEENENSFVFNFRTQQIKGLGECGCRSSGTKIVILKEDGNPKVKEFPWLHFRTVTSSPAGTTVELLKSELVDGRFQVKVSCES